MNTEYSKYSVQIKVFLNQRGVFDTKKKSRFDVCVNEMAPFAPLSAYIEGKTHSCQ